MSSRAGIEQLRFRTAPLEMMPEQFRSLGHDLVDRITGLLASLRTYPVTPGESPEEVRAALVATGVLPQASPPMFCCEMQRIYCLSTPFFNGHPRFYGYITSSAAPIGMLAELLAAPVNANVGAWNPADWGGLLLSGGNMANLTCFLAAHAAMAGWDVRTQGIAGRPRLCIYASKETHTWIQKAADLAGLGT